MSVRDFIAMISGMTGMVTAIGAIIVNVSQNRKTAALLDYRMQQVEKKLDIHNGYAEKIGNMEIAMATMQKDIEYIRNKE